MCENLYWKFVGFSSLFGGLYGKDSMNLDKGAAMFVFCRWILYRDKEEIMKRTKKVTRKQGSKINLGVSSRGSRSSPVPIHDIWIIAEWESLEHRKYRTLCFTHSAILHVSWAGTGSDLLLALDTRTSFSPTCLLYAWLLCFFLSWLPPTVSGTSTHHRIIGLLRSENTQRVHHSKSFIESVEFDS